MPTAEAIPESIISKGPRITLERTPHQRQVFVKALLDGPNPIPLTRAAKVAGLDFRTVKEISRRNDYDLDAIQRIQKRLPAKCYITADWAFDNITPQKLENCSAPQLMMVAGIAIDKARDMEGLNRPVFNMVELSISINKALNESAQRSATLSAQLAHLTNANNQTH